MTNPFDDKNKGQSAPSMFPQKDSKHKLAEYQYRIERFELGSQNSEEDALKIETLLNRSLTDEVEILERKDSVSATTGVYTMVIIYLEKTLREDNEEGRYYA